MNKHDIRHLKEKVKKIKLFIGYYDLEILSLLMALGAISFVGYMLWA
jgi:hypothetical protein